MRSKSGMNPASQGLSMMKENNDAVTVYSDGTGSYHCNDNFHCSSASGANFINMMIFHSQLYILTIISNVNMLYFLRFGTGQIYPYPQGYFTGTAKSCGFSRASEIIQVTIGA